MIETEFSQEHVDIFTLLGVIAHSASALDSSLAHLLGTLLGVPPAAGFALFFTQTSAPVRRQMIENVARCTTLKDSEIKKISSLLKRSSNAYAKRSNLLHGVYVPFQENGPHKEYKHFFATFKGQYAPYGASSKPMSRKEIREVAETLISLSEEVTSFTNAIKSTLPTSTKRWKSGPDQGDG